MISASGDRCPQRFHLLRQRAQRQQQHRWDCGVAVVQPGGELGEAAPPLRGDVAELGELAAHTVHQLRVLLDQQLPRPFETARRLLLDALDRHEAHVRTAERGADRRRVPRIGLVAADERLDVGGRDQPHLMALRPQRPPPMVRRAARLDADPRSRQLDEERLHL
jgi:hypothetical protein